MDVYNGVSNKTLQITLCCVSECHVVSKLHKYDHSLLALNIATLFKERT